MCNQTSPSNGTRARGEGQFNLSFTDLSQNLYNSKRRIVTWELMGRRIGRHIDTSTQGACNWCSRGYRRKRQQQSKTGRRNPVDALGSNRPVGPDRDSGVLDRSEPEPPCRDGTRCTCCGSPAASSPTSSYLQPSRIPEKYQNHYFFFKTRFSTCFFYSTIFIRAK